MKRSMDTIVVKALKGRYVGASVILIELIGVIPAIMLRQIEVFSEYHKNERDGHYWTYNSIKSWARATGFTPRQVQYALDKLAKRNLIFRTDSYNSKPYDHTLWYTVNDEALIRLVREYINTPPQPPTISRHEVAEQDRVLEEFRKGSGNVE